MEPVNNRLHLGTTEWSQLLTGSISCVPDISVVGSYSLVPVCLLAFGLLQASGSTGTWLDLPTGNQPSAVLTLSWDHRVHLASSVEGPGGGAGT